MKTSDTASETVPQTRQPARRVGSITFGIVLIIAGLAMLLSMFFPELDLKLLLQASPLILISLGIETLLSARKNEQLKYDWVAMLLCCLIVCTALVLFAVAWNMVHISI